MSQVFAGKGILTEWQTETGHELKRCEDYSGPMREDCLRGLRAAEGAAGAGATQRPEPPTAPPPQNPIGR